jgi:hypothetical protein
VDAKKKGARARVGFPNGRKCGTCRTLRYTTPQRRSMSAAASAWTSLAASMARPEAGGGGTARWVATTASQALRQCSASR